MKAQPGVVADRSRLHFCPLRLESSAKAMCKYGQASAPAAKRYVVWRQDRCNRIRKKIGGAIETIRQQMDC